MSMTWLHFPLEPWTHNSVSVSKENRVCFDEDNKICLSYYEWSKMFFQYAAITLRLTAIRVKDKTANNSESVTKIREGFEEFYRAIKKVDDELIQAIYKINKETQVEPIKVSASLLATADPLSDDSNAASVVKELWSQMKLIMDRAIKKMSSDSQWRGLFENLIRDGERISSNLLSLLKENSF